MCAPGPSWAHPHPPSHRYRLPCRPRDTHEGSLGSVSRGWRAHRCSCRTPIPPKEPGKGRQNHAFCPKMPRYSLIYPKVPAKCRNRAKCLPWSTVPAASVPRWWCRLPRSRVEKALAGGYMAKVRAKVDGHEEVDAVRLSTSSCPFRAGRCRMPPQGGSRRQGRVLARFARRWAVVRGRRCTLADLSLPFPREQPPTASVLGLAGARGRVRERDGSLRPALYACRPQPAFARAGAACLPPGNFGKADSGRGEESGLQPGFRYVFVILS